jgi:apolipoprotein N-acyltransferase
VDGGLPVAWPTAHRAIAAVLAAVVVWAAASAVMMRHPEPELRVAAIQPGAFVADGPRRVPVLSPEEELERSIVQTRAAALQGAELVVWREVGVPFDPRGAQGQVFADLARELGIHLVIGWQAPVAESEGWSDTSARFVGGRFNEAAAFSPDGRLLGSYGKSHPGEFAGDYSARPGEYIVYEAEWGGYGTIICFDLDFTDSARRTASLGANVLAVPSSDVPGIARKHYTHLVFRAIETRLPMVKADSAFDSAVIDPYGRIVAAFVAKEGAPATVVAEIPLGSGDTLYVRWGEWFGWLTVVGMAAFAAMGLIARRR